MLQRYDKTTKHRAHHFLKQPYMSCTSGPKAHAHPDTSVPSDRHITRLGFSSAGGQPVLLPPSSKATSACRVSWRNPHPGSTGTIKVINFSTPHQLCSLVPKGI